MMARRYTNIRRGTLRAARRAGVDTTNKQAVAAFKTEQIRKLKEYVRRVKKPVDMPSGHL
jgi:hypothetical protein